MASTSNFVEDNLFFCNEGRVDKLSFLILFVIAWLVILLVFLLSLPVSLFGDLAWNAPSIDPSYLIILLCSKAYKALTSSTKDILDRSLEFSKEEIVASYFLGRVTKIFWTILSLENSLPYNLILFAMLNNCLA